LNKRVTLLSLEHSETQSEAYDYIRGNLICAIASTEGAGLIIGALEDSDDNDDTAIGRCGWALSFRDKPKLYSLFLTETRLLPITCEMLLKL
jgi:hypothetical protein